MKAWSPEVPKCNIAESAASVVERRAEALAAQEAIRDKIHTDRIESERLKEELRVAGEQYKKSVKEVQDIRIEAKSLRAHAHERRVALEQDIQVCADTIKDLLHYIELYSLNAGHCARLMRVLKETLRRKRLLQDEVTLLKGTQKDLPESCTDTSTNEEGSYLFHLNRLNSPRMYHPRQITLAQALQWDGYNTTPVVNPKLSRFSHIKSKTK